MISQIRRSSPEGIPLAPQWSVNHPKHPTLPDHSASGVPMTRSQLALLSLATLAACSGGAKSNSAAADSLSRDLNRPATETTNALNDRPAAAPAAQPAAKLKPRPKAPAAPSPRTLAAGTLIEATMSDSIN